MQRPVSSPTPSYSALVAVITFALALGFAALFVALFYNPAAPAAASSSTASGEWVYKSYTATSSLAVEADFVFNVSAFVRFRDVSFSAQFIMGNTSLPIIFPPGTIASADLPGFAVPQNYFVSTACSLGFAGAPVQAPIFTFIFIDGSMLLMGNGAFDLTPLVPQPQFRLGTETSDFQDTFDRAFQDFSFILNCELQWITGPILGTPETYTTAMDYYTALTLFDASVFF
jgi:hypothetical protein